MRTRLTRAEMMPTDNRWRIILSLEGDAPDTVCHTSTKDEALSLISVYLRAANGRDLPAKPNYVSEKKIIYYFRRRI